MANIPLDDPLLANVAGLVCRKDGLSDILSDYTDDSMLIAQLGIEPTLVTDDCRLKLLDENSDYTTLLPPSPSYDSFTGTTANYRQTFYTIDTDIQSLSHENDLLTLGETYAISGQTYSTTVETASQPSIVLEANEPAQVQHVYTVIGDVQIAEEPMLCNSQDSPISSVQSQPGSQYSSAQSHLDSPFSSTQSYLDSPVSSIQSQPDSPVIEAPIPGRGRGVKRCAGRRRQASIEKPDKETPKPKSARRRRPIKPKKYEIQESLSDPVAEKKRLNAINAKHNREMKKNIMSNLEDKVNQVTQERDKLLMEVETLKKREQELRNQLHSKFGYELPKI